MFRPAFDEVQAIDVLRLIETKMPESMFLDFKRAIDISSREQKLELAKDVSAFANSVGGRIFYGIGEETLSDGSKVASELFPIAAGDLIDRLTDVILSSVHPRPRFRIRPVAIDEGSVILVEVYPSLGRDLHMVSTFGDMRFYRRSESHTQKMTEPEIREAYVRIAIAHSDLQSQMRSTISDELKALRESHEVIVVAPVYRRDNLIDPRMFGRGMELSQDLHNNVLNRVIAYFGERRLQVCATGYRRLRSDGAAVVDPNDYFGINRDGIVVLAERLDSHGPTDASGQPIPIVRTFFRLLGVLLAARHVHQKANYWGPVHIVHKWQFDRSARLSDQFSRSGALLQQWTCPQGDYTHTYAEFDLAAATPNEILDCVRELLDRMWQTFSGARCPWFTDSGEFAEHVKLRVDDLFPVTRAT